MDFPTLLPEPSVTLYLDGLIILVHNAGANLIQAGIHTQAEHHALAIEVTKTGEANPVWPRNEADWDGTHETVKAIAPLWLYVDSGGGRRPNEFSAALHNPHDLSDVQSFGYVLDFEGPKLYGRTLDYRLDALAVLNIGHGSFYSAENMISKLKKFEQDQRFDQAYTVDHLKVSAVVAADIDSVSDKKVERSIVFEQTNPEKELFRFKLERGTHYEIKIMNMPDDSVQAHTHIHSPESHFLQYYELFPLRAGEKKFLVELDGQKPTTRPDLTQLSPPCNTGTGGRTTSFI
jgi:hypothetical protein